MSPTLARDGASGSRSELELVFCTASMHSGLLLEPSVEAHVRDRLEGLAATLPELFGVVDPTCLDRIAQRAGGEAPGQTFGEMLLLSDEHVHLIQPLRSRPGVALLSSPSNTTRPPSGR